MDQNIYSKQEEHFKAIDTPKNEFLERKQELFTMKLKMPMQFKEDWYIFRKHCNKLGIEFEDVLGDLMIQFNNGSISFKGE